MPAIDVLPSVFNAVIMIAVLSVGNSSVYGSSRTLAALAEQQQAPRILAYIDRKGRPIVSIAIASIVGLLAFLAGSDQKDAAFNWMIALSGLSSIFTWGSICLAHIRFRRAWKLQGHSLNEIPFRGQPGVIGSWFGFVFNFLILIAQFWVGAWPIGWRDRSAAELVQGFFELYLAVPVVLLFYIPYKLYYRCAVVRAHNMDLHTGIRDFNVPELIAEEKAERATWPAWKRVYKFFC